MTDNASLVGRMKGAIRARGTLIYLRAAAATGVSGNPPTVVNPVADGDQPIGATTLTLRADDAYGALVAGDRIRVGSMLYAVAAAASARALPSAGDTTTSYTPGFSAVPITTAVRVDIPDGTPVQFVWSADSAYYAMISGYPLNVVDGSLIQARDLRVLIAAEAFEAPTLLSKIVIPGDPSSPRTVVGINPVYYGSIVIQWQLQAR